MNRLFTAPRRLTAALAAITLFAATAGFERAAVADEKKQVAAAQKSQ